MAYCVHLHAGHEPTWISFDPSGQGQEGGHIELGPDESSGQLQLTVQAGRRFVAGGVIAVQDLWQVGRGGRFPPPLPSPSPLMLFILALKPKGSLG